MGDSRLGFNKEKVEELSNPIKKVYYNCVQGILEEIKKGVVDPMSHAWYAPEACAFFGDAEPGITVDEENLKKIVKDETDGIFKCFDGFRKDIQEAGQHWYNNTKAGNSNGEANAEKGGNEVQLATFDKKDLELNVTPISKQDGAGNIYLDPDAVDKVVKGLPDCQKAIADRMLKEKTILNATTAFIGGGQSEAIDKCFVELLKAVSKIFKWLSEGEGSLDKAFTKASIKYDKIAKGIADRYNKATFDQTSN